MAESFEPEEYEVVLERVTERVVIRPARPRQLPSKYESPVVQLPPYQHGARPKSPAAPAPTQRKRTFAQENPLVVIWAVALVIACGFEVKACYDQANVPRCSYCR